MYIVLWDAVPSYLRKLNEQFEMSVGRSIPVDHSPIKFSSWMGGGTAYMHILYILYTPNLDILIL